jgi:hypothetical protein
MKDDVTLVVERLLPDERPDFFDEFWAMAEDREHRSARRWRRIALTATVAALLAVTTAVVVAAPFGRSSVVDETLTCRIQAGRGGPSFALTANPRRPNTTNNYAGPAQLLLTTGGDFFYGTKLLMLDESMQGSSINRSLCTKGGPPVPLTPKGLRPRIVLGPGMFSSHDVTCRKAGEIVVHLRTTMSAKGTPTRAEVAVHLAARNSPAVYAEWSAHHLTMYGAEPCTDEGF